MENVRKFENVGHSDPVIFMSLDTVSMQICVKYEGFMIMTMLTGEAIIMKRKNGCHLKTIGHVHLIMPVHVLRKNSVRYEVSVI